MLVIETYLKRLDKYDSIMDENAVFDSKRDYQGIISIQNKNSVILGKEHFLGGFGIATSWYYFLNMLESYFLEGFGETSISCTCDVKIFNFKNKIAFSIHKGNDNIVYNFNLSDFFVPTLLTASEYFFSFMDRHTVSEDHYAQTFERIKILKEKVILFYQSPAVIRNLNRE